MADVTIKKRWSGVEIELPDDCPRTSIKAILEWCARRAREGKSSANLDGANLDGANLYGANLYGANLVRANLYGANLVRANLVRANLYGAKGLQKHITTPLFGLYLQVGAIRAFKLVNANGHGPHYTNDAPYDVGTFHEVNDADTDESVQCGRGLNVATLDWVCKGWSKGQRILLVEHKRADIAAIPIGSDGKYRVHRLKVVRELDPADFGLGVESDEPTP